MRLAPGQTVRVPPFADTSPRAPLAPLPNLAVRRELEGMVLYRDDDLIVLNKPFGLPVQGGPGISRHLDRLLDEFRFGHAERPRLVHRLDRDTSGVLVLARAPGVAAKLASAFRGHGMEKTYWAVVAGRPVPADGRIDLALVRTGRWTDRVALAEQDDAEAARAITDYRTLDYAARKLAWLELQPLTGRTHQLRVHCAALGTPILGDAKYGTERNTDERGPRNAALVEGLPAQLHLHARRLVLPHPAGGALEAEAELPPRMHETFRMLGFSAPPAQAARRK